MPQKKILVGRKKPPSRKHFWFFRQPIDIEEARVEEGLIVGRKKKINRRPCAP